MLAEILFGRRSKRLPIRFILQRTKVRTQSQAMGQEFELYEMKLGMVTK
jgi:hypothetical protein